MSQQHYTLTLTCPDRPGIVRALAEGIFRLGGNIVDNAQYTDPVTGFFCVRTVFGTGLSDDDAVRATLTDAVASLDATLALRRADEPVRTLVMVSQFDHCLVDLLYRWRIGELPIDIAAVVSNHDSFRDLVSSYGIPFVHIQVTAETKPVAEQQLLEVIESRGVELVVLARYMQILSEAVCQRLPGRIINIHHSFLPGFKGGSAYRQAFERGVKLIGATAHYVTGDLDEGPIIEQDVVRVSHAHNVDSLVAIGRDVERIVLARAVRLHAESRVLQTGKRTVVFP